VAWHPKSSTENERTTVVTENSAGIPVLFRQIAGALARRIVWYVKEGDKVKQGEQFGFIKFGSRVDIFVPLGTEIKVAIGEVVKGGQTILAEFGAGIKKAKVETAHAEDQPVIVATDVPTKPVKIAVDETSVTEIVEVEKPEKVDEDDKPTKAEPAKKEDKTEKASAKTETKAEDVKVTAGKSAKAPVATEPPSKSAVAKKPAPKKKS
jgi:phosphatidylserine decarboxylase